VSATAADDLAWVGASGQIADHWPRSLQLRDSAGLSPASSLSPAIRGVGHLGRTSIRFSGTSIAQGRGKRKRRGGPGRPAGQLHCLVGRPFSPSRCAARWMDRHIRRHIRRHICWHTSRHICWHTSRHICWHTSRHHLLEQRPKS